MQMQSSFLHFLHFSPEIQYASMAAAAPKQRSLAAKRNEIVHACAYICKLVNKYMRFMCCETPASDQQPHMLVFLFDL